VAASAAALFGLIGVSFLTAGFPAGAPSVGITGFIGLVFETSSSPFGVLFALSPSCFLGLSFFSNCSLSFFYVSVFAFSISTAIGSSPARGGLFFGSTGANFCVNTYLIDFLASAFAAISAT